MQFKKVIKILKQFVKYMKAICMKNFNVNKTKGIMAARKTLSERVLFFYGLFFTNQFKITNSITRRLTYHS